MKKIVLGRRLPRDRLVRLIDFHSAAGNDARADWAVGVFREVNVTRAHSGG